MKKQGRKQIPLFSLVQKVTINQQNEMKKKDYRSIEPNIIRSRNH